MEERNQCSTRQLGKTPLICHETVSEFVGHRFGEEAAKKLTNISIGGSNNEKGSKYERYCAVLKIVEEAFAHRYETLIANQLTGFVDDLSVIVLASDHQKTSPPYNASILQKTNYQIKNSPTAGRWNDAHALRFAQQETIDIEHFNAKSSKQVMLVSDLESYNLGIKALKNGSSITFGYEFVSYDERTFVFIRQNPTFRAQLSELCDSTDLEWLDSAFAVLLGAWESCNSAEQVKIGDVLDFAKQCAAPDLLGGVNLNADQHSYTIPLFLVDRCSTLKIGRPIIKSGRIVLNLAGLEVSMPLNGVEMLSESSVQECADARQLVDLFLTISANEFLPTH